MISKTRLSSRKTLSRLHRTGSTGVPTCHGVRQTPIKSRSEEILPRVREVMFVTVDILGQEQYRQGARDVVDHERLLVDPLSDDPLQFCRRDKGQVNDCVDYLEQVVPDKQVPSH